MRRLHAITIAALVACGPSVTWAQEPAPAAPPEAPPAAEGLLPEPAFITKAVGRVDRESDRRGEPKDGFYVEMGKMPAGAGWLSVGPGYRRHVFNGAGVARVSGSLSTRMYKMAQAGLEFPHLRNDRAKVGVQTMWRDSVQVNFYGLGNQSNPVDRSGYRLRTHDTTAYASVGSPVLQLRGRAGWLGSAQPSGMSGRTTTYPNAETIFNESGAPGLLDDVSYLHADVSLSSDTRNNSGYPTDGDLFQVTWSTYSDQKTGRHSFQRLEGEATSHTPIVSHWWILSLRGSVVASGAGDGHDVPVYLMPNLGGRNLRSYADYRFHDRNLHAYAVESRWAVFPHLEAAAFAEAGSVAPAFGKLGFSDLKRSYGFGVRLHSRKSTIARVDVARGAEGWRVLLKLNDPFHPSRESTGWRVIAPFSP